MKKATLSVMILFFMLFVGCGKQTDTNISIEENNSNAYINFFRTGEMIYDDGLIFGNNNAQWLDFKTMEKTVLCTRPNCTHINSECTANIIGDTPIIHEDYIYFFEVSDGINEKGDSREFYISSKLKRISLDTSEVELICEFTDCEPREYDGCVLVGDNLFFCGDDMNPTEDEHGVITCSRTGGNHYLCCINLKKGTYTNYGSIYDEDKEYEASSYSSSAKIRGYYNSKIYIEYSFMKEYFQFGTDTSDVDPRDVFTILNFEFDLTSEKFSRSKLSSPSYAKNNNYVCSNYPDKSSTVIVNGEIYTVNDVDTDLFGKVGNNKLFINGGWYNITNSKAHGLGEYADWKFLTIYNNDYIFSDMYNSEFVKLTEEELLALDKE